MFVSGVFHVIFSFVHFISLYTLGGLHAFRNPLPYNMCLFNLRFANHILIKILINKEHSSYVFVIVGTIKSGLDVFSNVFSVRRRVYLFLILVAFDVYYHM